MAETPKQQTESSVVPLPAQLLAALQTRTGLRQAFLLVEILAPPVAQRRPRSRAAIRAFAPFPDGTEGGEDNAPPPPG